MNRPGEETLIRYFRGGCSPEEQKAIEIYLAMDIDGEYKQKCLQEAIGDLDKLRGAFVDQEELDRIWTRFTAMKAPAQQEAAPVMPLRSRSRWYAYAAAVVLLVLCGTVFYFLNNHNISSHPVTWQQISAGTGQIRKLYLPDSSVVTLFAGSVAGIPEDFGKKDRSIKLTGKAFFEIRNKANKPFYVLSRGLTTQVLGTTFEVRTPNTADAENIVTLHTGKVSIRKEGKEIARLDPNQQFRYQSATGRYEVAHVEAAYTIAWMKGEFDYDQVPLRTVLDDLENWYGVKLIVADPALSAEKITISFKSLSIDQALTIFSRAAGFTYTRQANNQIIIKKGGI